MLLALAALFVASLGFGVVVPQLPDIVGRQAASAEVLSAMFVGFSAPKIAVQLPGGVAVDRWSVPRVLLVAMSCDVAGTFGLVVASHPTGLVAARVLQGVATGLIYPAAFAAIAGHQDRGGRAGMGPAGAAMSVGMLGGYALAGALAPVTGPRAPLVVVGVLGLAVLVALALQQLHSSQTPVTPAGLKSGSRRTVRTELARVLSPMTQLAFLAFLLPVAFNKLTFTGFNALIPVIGPDQLGWGTADIALLLGAAGLVFGLTQMVVGKLGHELPARFVILGLGAILVIVVLAHGGAGPSRFAGLFLGYIAVSSAIFVLSLQHLADRSSADRYGSTFGSFSTLTDLMTVAGPPLWLGLHAGGASVYAWSAAIGTGLYVIYGVSLLRRSFRFGAGPQEERA